MLDRDRVISICGIYGNVLIKMFVVMIKFKLVHFDLRCLIYPVFLKRSDVHSKANY